MARILTPACPPERPRGRIGTLPAHSRNTRTLLLDARRTQTHAAHRRRDHRHRWRDARRGAAARARSAPPATTSWSTARTRPQDADGVRAALDGAWDAIRAHALPPDARRSIVLIAPPPGDPHHEAARAGLENLARTLSIEWARHGDPARRDPPRRAHRRASEVAELVAFLASRAGAYYAGCAFTPSLAHGTSTESSVGESRATTYSAGSVSDRLRTMCVWRGGT